MDEFAAFMAEINADPSPSVPSVPKKRGLPAAYHNRPGMYESNDAKTRRIEKEAQKVSGIKVDNSLAMATISAAPVRANATTVKPAVIENINDRKIGLEKFNSTPFFGNEQQAFSLKKESAITTLAAAPQSYSNQANDEKKQKHMSDKELKAKIEVQPTSAFSIGPKPEEKKKKKEKEKDVKVDGQKPAFVGMDKKLETRGKKFVRRAAGETWEDNTLGEWDPSDYRLFCGDLGNEVTDEILSRAFNKYPSFLKAKVVREKGPKMGKTKGYGFVSFRDPEDFIKAMREMNGKYVGNRPIKLRKSSWKDRQIEVVKKKTKEKRKLGYRV